MLLLKPQSAPGPVDDITVDIRATRIKLWWNPPVIRCGTPVQFYNITHQLINYDQCNETTGAGVYWRKKAAIRPRLSLGSNPDKEIILPYSTYNISITATNSNGVGKPHYFQVVTGVTGKNLRTEKTHNKTIQNIPEQNYTCQEAMLLNRL